MGDLHANVVWAWLEHTEVRDVHAPALQPDYQLYIGLPDSYASGSKHYPVVFVTDAIYALALAMGLMMRRCEHLCPCCSIC